MYLLSRAIVFAILGGVICVTATAGDVLNLRMRPNAVIESQVVRLSDLVEPQGNVPAEVDSVLKLPLAPAPREGKSQEWSRKSIEEHLKLRGIDPTIVRWSGSEKITIERGLPTQAAKEQLQTGQYDGPQMVSVRQPTNTIPSRNASGPIAPAFLNKRVVEQAEAILKQAINEYVSLQSGDTEPWRITVKFPQQFASILQVKSNIVALSGGKAPWKGAQEFKVDINDRGAVRRVTVIADLQPPPMVVVAKSAIALNRIIEPEDLTYSPLPIKFDDQLDKFFTDISDLEGKQVRHAINTGQPISADSVGDPVVVKRGDSVEVVAISGSVSVKTAGVAMEAGPVGQAIQVELLDRRQGKRKRILAQVAGPQKVTLVALGQKEKDTKK